MCRVHLTYSTVLSSSGCMANEESHTHRERSRTYIYGRLSPLHYICYFFSLFLYSSPPRGKPSVHIKYVINPLPDAARVNRRVCFFSQDDWFLIEPRRIRIYKNERSVYNNIQLSFSIHRYSDNSIKIYTV